MSSLRAFVNETPAQLLERQAALDREKHGGGVGGEDVIAGLEVGGMVRQRREQRQPRFAEFLDIPPVGNAVGVAAVAHGH
jgi:hypothetical protein